MTILDLAPYIGVILGALALLTQLKTIFSSGEKQLEERTTKSENKLVELDRRVQALESEMRHLPDKEMTHRLELAMEKISGRLDTIDAKLKPITATGERLTELLLEQAK